MSSVDNLRRTDKPNYNVSHRYRIRYIQRLPVSMVLFALVDFHTDPFYPPLPQVLLPGTIN